MRREERAALAAIIAAGVVQRTTLDPQYPNVRHMIAENALGIADIIIARTEADEKAANTGDNRT